MKVYDALADAFVEERATTMFGLMGDGNMFWMGAMAERPGVRVVHARHENMAVAMADGFSRVTGRVGLCSVTCGPGVTQIATSLTAAARARSSVVVFAGDTPIGASFHLQEFVQRPYVESTGALFVGVTGIDRIAEDVQQAFYLARTRRLPVVLSVPYDLQDREYEWELDYRHSDELVPPPQRVVPTQETITKVRDLLLTARRPVLVAGWGAVVSGARDEILQLGEKTGALLTTTLRAKGWFEGQRFNAGLCGAFATDTARRLLADADCVVGIGARLGYYTTEGGYMFPEAKVIQIDTDPHGYIDGGRTADVFVHGDARETVAALAAAITSPTGAGYRSDSVLAEIAEPDNDDMRYELEPGTVDPRDAMLEFSRTVPADWLTVIGAGHYWNFTVPTLRDRPPHAYLYTYDFGVVGQGMPNAIGAALGDPDRRVALIEGDGSLMMNIQELETIHRHDVPLLIIAMNDGAYGAEVHKMRSRNVSGEEAVFGRPDLAAIARGFGLEASTVTADGQLQEAIEAYRANPRPTLIDVHMSSNVLSRQYRRLFFGKV